MKFYKTDLKNNYYVTSNTSNKLEKISAKEFFEKTKYDKKILNKLKKSVYPWQVNDYVILRFPSWYPNDYGKYVPADYKISNIIKYLWTKKIITLGWNQPDYILHKKNYASYIVLEHKTIDEIIKLFGENNIEIIDYTKNPSLIQPSFIQYSKEWLKIDKKIILSIKKDFISIHFFEKNLKWIHKKLDIEKPKKKDASEGSIILRNEELNEL
jgi:hypothetical protein